jgi:hypothetical protein
MAGALASVALASSLDDVSVASADTRPKIEAMVAGALENLQPSGKLRRRSTEVTYTPDMPSGKDSSWGAACIVEIDGKPQGRWFCGDWMVGTFSSRRGRATTADRLGRFVARECSPGA